MTGFISAIIGGYLKPVIAPWIENKSMIATGMTHKIKATDFCHFARNKYILPIPSAINNNVNGTRKSINLYERGYFPQAEAIKVIINGKIIIMAVFCRLAKSDKLPMIARARIM